MSEDDEKKKKKHAKASFVSLREKNSREATRVAGCASRGTGDGSARKALCKPPRHKTSRWLRTGRVFACKAFVGGSGASVGRLPSPRRGSASPWDPSVSSLLVDVGGVGYPLRCGAPASRLLLRCTADLRFHFFETATFPFFPDRSKFPRNGGEGTGSRIAVGRQDKYVDEKNEKTSTISSYASVP